MARRRRPTYSPEFKAEAIRLLRTSADPAKKVARDLGVSVSTLEAWMRATRPPSDPALTTDERAELVQLRREVQQLREERYLKKSHGLLRQAPRVMFAVVQSEKAHHTVRHLCRTLGLSPSGFYAWQRRRPSARGRTDRRLSVYLRAAHQVSGGSYGSPRLQRELRG